MTNRSWQLTSTHTLTLALPNQRGYCQKCHSEKDIWLISDTSLETRHFCWSCSLDKTRKFEVGDYQVKNKEQIIKELRAVLLSNPNQQENILNYHG